MRIVFVLLSLVIGLLLVFGGYRLARLVIPLMGFLAGLSLGGAFVADSAGSSFLGTVLGVAIGLTVGLAFAVLAYFYYYVAVIVLTAGLGYWAGSGFVLLFGFSPGLLSALLGIVVGMFVGILAIIGNAPKYVLIFLTSMAGAVTTIGGVMLLFRQIPLDTYSYTTTNVALSNSFLWTLAALALLAVGIIAQLRTSGGYDFETWSAGGDHHDHHITPTTPTHVGGGVA